MSSSLQDITDYIEDECTQQDALIIYDKAHEIVLQLMNMGANGVLVANMVAAQINNHTVQQPVKTTIH